jgi:hypothetical protein
MSRRNIIIGRTHHDAKGRRNISAPQQRLGDQGNHRPITDGCHGVAGRASSRVCNDL